MKTELDRRKYIYWFPLFLNYDSKKICIRLEELFTNPEAENVEIGNNFLNGFHRVESTKDSKKYDIIFDKVTFFQVYDELRHIDSDEEQFDNGVIRTYTKSNLLKYIENNTAFKMILGNYFNNLIHYCVRTSADWFDIVTASEPIIKLVDINKE
jgi:hypothetical protein